MEYTSKILNIVVHECPNLLIRYKNDFGQILELVETQENKAMFVQLFDKKAILSNVKQNVKDDTLNQQYNSCLS